MQILDVSELAKHVLDVFLRGLLMHIRDDNDPAFYAAYRDCVRRGASVGVAAVLRRGTLIDIHFRVSHGDDGSVLVRVWV